ncbi:fumarylacetoacetate hydrolase family protein [Pseudonocardia sp. RS010]|uniref:fumarylacetoacetate hydrolase family protein n=1 Tax=Pseudonocardia sp. RS010 TaxID=3385979 RepID=UPI0039A39FC4
MRLIRFSVPGDERVRRGVLDAHGRVRPVEGTERPARDVGGLADVVLHAPVEPGLVVGVGRNYAAHAEELGNPVPEAPLIFLKAASSVQRPDGEIVAPSLSRRVQHEAELAVVIGREARHVCAADADAYIRGYTLANDVTARDLQFGDLGIGLAKGFDTFCPVGPWIETELDLDETTVTAEVDGVVRQHGAVADMLFPVPYLLEFVTKHLTLRPGDLILTGTPPGVGDLVPGDVVTVTAPGLGALRNPVVAEQPLRGGSRPVVADAGG